MHAPVWQGVVSHAVFCSVAATCRPNSTSAVLHVTCRRAQRAAHGAAAGTPCPAHRDRTWLAITPSVPCSMRVQQFRWFRGCASGAGSLRAAAPHLHCPCTAPPARPPPSRRTCSSMAPTATPTPSVRTAMGIATVSWSNAGRDGDSANGQNRGGGHCHAANALPPACRAADAAVGQVGKHARRLHQSRVYRTAVTRPGRRQGPALGGGSAGAAEQRAAARRKRCLVLRACLALLLAQPIAQGALGPLAIMAAALQQGLRQRAAARGGSAAGGAGAAVVVGRHPRALTQFAKRVPWVVLRPMQRRPRMQLRSSIRAGMCCSHFR